MSDATTKALLKLLCRWVEFQPAFVKVGGGLSAGVLLSKAYQWADNETAIERGGWFYKTHAQWEAETGMTRREQETARKHLRAKGLLQERPGSVNGRRVTWYRVDLDKLHDALAELSQTLAVEDTTRARAAVTTAGESAPRHARVAPASDAQNRLEQRTEPPEAVHGSAAGNAPNRHSLPNTPPTTSENTAEHTHTRARADRAPAPPAPANAGVCVNKISLKAFERYGQNQRGIHSPEGWAVAARRAGDLNEKVRDWCVAHGIDPATGENVARPAEGLAPRDAGWSFEGAREVILWRLDMHPAFDVAGFLAYADVSDETREKLLALDWSQERAAPPSPKQRRDIANAEGADELRRQLIESATGGGGQRAPYDPFAGKPVY